MAKIPLILSNLEMTQKLGEILGQRLPAGNVVLLEGDLGTGKTSLIQGLGRDSVSLMRSPVLLSH